MPRSFWTGAAAGCAFLVVELAGRVLAGVPTIPELIQDRLVLLLPGPLFAFVLDRLLYLGKPSLFIGLGVIQLLLAGLGGVLFQRWRQPIALALIPWLLTGLVVLPAAGRGIFAGAAAVALVDLLAFAAYAAALSAYSGRPAAAEAAGADGPPVPGGAAALDRRAALGGGLTFLASLLLGRQIIGALPSLPPRPGAAPVPPAATPAAGTGARAASTPPPTAADPSPITPIEQFYVVSKNLIDPVVDASSWKLRISGHVQQPLTLTYSDILALPSVEAYRTLECISNEVGGDLISTGLWTGVRLADLLRRAGVAPEATLLVFTSVDGYTESMPLPRALDPATLLAYRLNGQPLPPKHGFPLRVLGTGTYGMKNPKWLTEIQVATSAPPGFWERQGWSADAIVQTMSRIDTPADGATLGPGPVVVRGIAFAGDRGIQKVELSADGGRSWQAAALSQPLGPNTWTLWRTTWRPPGAGTYELTVRATDGSGRLQAGTATDTFPAGATGYHTISVRVTT